MTSDPDHAKSDTPREEKARLGGTKSYFGYKLHGAIP